MLAGDRLRSLVGSLTNNRLMAVGVGTVVTLILQSSTATTVMLVGFATTGAITLTQAMGVILGADIGTTFVVILLTLKQISDYALLMLIAGVLMEIISSRAKTRNISMVLLGFGFVFFGMQLLVRVTSPLRDNPLLSQIFAVLADHPFYALVAAMIFTGLVQNSATTLGLAIALSLGGLLQFREAVPIVLGANIGTCTGSLLHCLGGHPSARRVALSHLLFKLSGVFLALIFLNPFTSLIGRIAEHLSRLYPVSAAGQIALTHVVFNFLLSLFFLPLIPLGARFIQKIVPEPFRPEEQAFGPKYLDPSVLETPALAFANTKRELLRMAEIAFEMLRNALLYFKNGDSELKEYIEDQDDKVDILDRDIKMYLARLSQESLNPEQARLQLNLVAMTTDLEEVCDIINKNILDTAIKRLKRGQKFSSEGETEIVEMHSKVLENFQLAICAVTMEDEALARKVIRHDKDLIELEDRCRESHLYRLHKGMKDSIETSPLHLDLLSNLRRIDTKLVAIVRTTFAGREI